MTSISQEIIGWIVAAALLYWLYIKVKDKHEKDRGSKVIVTKAKGINAEYKELK